ncbi:hypothetical protein JAAARDRAFT_40178 [Jaapia argillacea MUCL 33604]|uniref:[histone H3]-trimethyl-L-lysine(9) demethylase n=1 Tax=Jaapia argillacea MUCL 33604 TaxID=933084 RepID=A0A067PCD2_9AGAM|nr:hypothetical protein JAAARDRAFT_40178 [Jaapia argillacea MUCL 33604]
MSVASSSTPSLTPSRSPTPVPPVQPDHFYGSDNSALPLSPDSDGKAWLDPEDDPLAQRGIPVFKPTMEEFRDFEEYMNKVDAWGKKSGIIKIIPPKEWRDALPPLTDQLAAVKIKSPIEQHMLGRGGLFRAQNMEKRKLMSVREWYELCNNPEYRAPGVDDVGLYRAAGTAVKKTRRGRRNANAENAETAEPEEVTDPVDVKQEPDIDIHPIEFDPSDKALVSPPDSSAAAEETPAPDGFADVASERASVFPDREATAVTEGTPGEEEKPKSKTRRGPTREVREAMAAERAAKDAAFLESFDPQSDWLPANTTPFDFTPEFCQKLERQYWRNLGLGKPAWYGADTAGSLFTDETKAWNVAHLQSALTRLLPSSSKGLPGVNTPYLYFGMWRATFAWHLEDMDLYSINYIHFGAPKHWYAIPQARSGALEQTMKGYFPKDGKQCSQFLRHKQFLASPTLLSQSSCRPNLLVQQAGEFVITYPRGYHAGFNLGFNCAESVNFALDSWLDMGRKAQACECINDSVRIDVEQLLRDREAERLNPPKSSSRSATQELVARPRKRKLDGEEEPRRTKRPKVKTETSPSKAQNGTIPKRTVMLKLPPKPKEPTAFPCCLCVSERREGLLRVIDPPVGRKDVAAEVPAGQTWMAHSDCAHVIPETWVDEIEVGTLPDGSPAREQVVYGVDGIVKDRWNLKCSACTKTRNRAHGAPIQCTKGKCPKAFHVSCARDGNESGIMYSIIREVEKEVVLLDPTAAATPYQDGFDNGEVSSQVLKVIRKQEVQVLCPQHNPALAEAKKALKLDKVRQELIGLPTMSRIKIRVSSGVFEVSLVRVIEPTKSVEVIWSNGVKREFKWGSVVFGNVDAQMVGQKPTELLAEAEGRKYPSAVDQHIHTFSAVTSSGPTLAPRPPRAEYSIADPPTVHSPAPAPTPPAAVAPPTYQPQYPPSAQPMPAYNYAGWTYTAQGYCPPPQAATYASAYTTTPYNPYYGNYAQPYQPNGYASSSYPQYQGYNNTGQYAQPPAPRVPPVHAYTPPQPVHQDRRQQLQWKQPITGPSRSSSSTPVPRASHHGRDEYMDSLRPGAFEAGSSKA